MKIFGFLTAFVVTMALSMAEPAQAAPIDNIVNDTIGSSTKNMSNNQIADTIIRAGLKRDWIIRRTGPNTLQARVDVRTHTAVVDIKFSKQSFSITYNSSKNLNYRNGNIHRNYNRWVNKLENDIVIALYERSLR